MSDAPYPFEHTIFGFPASTTRLVGVGTTFVVHSLIVFFPFSLAKPEIAQRH